MFYAYRPTRQHARARQLGTLRSSYKHHAVRQRRTHACANACSTPTSPAVARGAPNRASNHTPYSVARHVTTAYAPSGRLRAFSRHQRRACAAPSPTIAAGQPVATCSRGTFARYGDARLLCARVAGRWHTFGPCDARRVPMAVRIGKHRRRVPEHRGRGQRLGQQCWTLPEHQVHGLHPHRHCTCRSTWIQVDILLHTGVCERRRPSQHAAAVWWGCRR